MKDHLGIGNGNCMNCEGTGCMNCKQQTVVFSISFTDGVVRPENIGNPSVETDYDTHAFMLVPSQWDGFANTLPQALQIAAAYMASFRKDLIDANLQVPEGAQCFIDMRVCSTTGTTTQVVHMIG